MQTINPIIFIIYIIIMIFEILRPSLYFISNNTEIKKNLVLNILQQFAIKI